MRFRERLPPWLRWFLGMRPTPLPVGVPDVSVTVIVPAYNEDASISNTLESLLRQTYPIQEIIVVDDCSRDWTPEIAEWYARDHPTIRVIRTPVNQGSKAMSQNYVLGEIVTDLFVTIDGDTMLAPDAVEKTLPYFHNQNTLIVCGFVIPQKINTFWERARFIEYLYGLSIIKPAQDHWRTIMVASGCFSVFRTKELVNTFGGFKKRTIVEDMDLTWEVIEAGYDVYFAQDAKCYPVDPATFPILFDQLERWYCGFFQNIMVRGNLYRHNKRLATAAYGYMLWSFVGASVIPLVGWSLTHDLWSTVAIVLLSSLLFAGVPSFIQAHRFGMLKEALISFPAFIPLTYINAGIFLYAAVRELILRNKLTKWKKGHA